MNMDKYRLSLDQRTIVIRMVSIKLGTLDVTTLNDVARERLYDDMLLKSAKYVIDSSSLFLQEKIGLWKKFSADSMKSRNMEVPIAGGTIHRVYRELFRKR